MRRLASLLVTVASLAVLACGGDDPAAKPAHQSTSGCSAAPACDACVTCFESCVCQGKTIEACADSCSSWSGAGGAGASLQTVTIATAPRTIEAGGEAFFCQNFSNPFPGSVDVLRSESFMTPGSHHMFVFYEPGATDGPVEDCSGLEYKRTLHTAQTPQHLTSYPEGVGRRVDGSTGLRVAAHYFNSSTKPVEAVLVVKFAVAPTGTVDTLAGSLFFLNPGIYVEPYQTGSATDTCAVPLDIQLIDVVSHMHRFGTGFSSQTGAGEAVYHTTDWDEPKPAVFDPPLAIGAGDSITYTCQYKNVLDTPLTFGESASTNEMCILSGTYFPAPGGQTLGCN